MSQQQPFISIVVSSYNHAKYVAETLESVFNQTYKNFELIFLDNGSTDGVLEVVTRYQDPRLKVIRVEDNLGVYGGFNLALKHASGEFISILCSDDLYEPEKLEKQVRASTETGCGAIFSTAIPIGEAGEPFSEPGHFYNHVFIKENRSREEWLAYFLYSGNCLCFPSAFIRRDLFNEIGYYIDERLTQLGDFELWLRLLSKSELHVIQEPLVKFRVRAGELNLSGNNDLNRRRWPVEQYWLLDRLVTVAPDLFEKTVESKPASSKSSIDKFAKTILSSGVGPYQLFALTKLFEQAPINPSSVTERERLNLFADAMKKSDPFCAAESHNLRNEIAELKGKLRTATTELETIRSSRLFRIRAKLQIVRSLFLH